MLDLGTCTFREFASSVSAEQEKALYWYNRKFGSEEQNPMVYDKICEAKKNGIRNVLCDASYYEAKSGNKWAVYEVCYWNREFTHTKSGKHLSLYNDGEYPWVEHGYKLDEMMNLSADGKNTLLIYSPSFLKDWSDSNNCNEKGIEIARRLNAENPWLEFVVLDERSIAVIGSGFIGCGFIREETDDGRIIQVDSLLDNGHHRMKELASIQETINSRIDMFDIPEEERRKCLIYGDGGFSGDTSFFDMYVEILFELYKVIEGEYPHTIDDVKTANVYAKVVNNLKDCVKGKSRDRLEDILIAGYASIAMVNRVKGNRQKMQHRVDEITLFVNINVEKLREYIKKIVNAENDYFMEQKAHTELNAVLKKYGLVSKFEKGIAKLSSLHKEQYYKRVESIYAISRLIPEAESDATREKMEKANIDWLGVVVDKDLCPQLAEYYDRYGKDMVKKAILYLAENHLWDSPVSDKSLKTKMPSNFDGLKAIDEAVVFIKENEPVVEVVEEPAATEQPHESKREDYNAAKQAYDDMMTALSKAQKKMEAFGRLVINDELTDMLEKENASLDGKVKELEKKVIELGDKADADALVAEKRLRDLEGEKQVLKSELGREKKAKEEANSNAYKERKAREDAEAKLSALQKRYDKMQKEFDELKLEAQKSLNMKSAKFIPRSAFACKPLMGEKTIGIIKDVLSKYNIEINDDK